MISNIKKAVKTGGWQVTQYFNGIFFISTMAQEGKNEVSKTVQSNRGGPIKPSIVSSELHLLLVYCFNIKAIIIPSVSFVFYFQRVLKTVYK